MAVTGSHLLAISSMKRVTKDETELMSFKVLRIVTNPKDFFLFSEHHSLSGSYLLLVVMSITFAILTMSVEVQTFYKAKAEFFGLQGMDVERSLRIFKLIFLVSAAVSPTVSSLIITLLSWILGTAVRAFHTEELSGDIWKRVGTCTAMFSSDFRKILYVAVWGEVTFTMCNFIILPFILMKSTTSIEISLRPLVVSVLGGSPTALYEFYILTLSVPLVWETVIVGVGLQNIFGFKNREGILVSAFIFGLVHLIKTVYFA